MRIPRDVPHLTLYALAAALAIAFLVAATTSTAAFGTFNPNWDGTAELRGEADERTELRLIRGTAPYGSVEPEGTIAFVLAPEEPYESVDVVRISEFVRGGGTLVVADSFGPHGNALLSDVGADARFRGAMLRDEEYYHRSPAMPVALETADHPYAAGVDGVTLNHGTAVEPNGATPIVNTSSLAYLDRDGNGELGEDEELASYPVVTIEEVGEGQVVAIGDPSVFINAMLDRPGNRAFLVNLLATHDRTVLDLSRGGEQPPIAIALISIRASGVLQALTGLVVLGITIGFVTRRDRAKTLLERRFGRDEPRPRDPDPDPDALAAEIRAAHPDWDDERIRRVIAGVIPRERQDTDDE